jgi:hypothetical protein
MNPYRVVVDEQVIKFRVTARADVTASGWPLDQGKYLIYSDAPAGSEMWVIYSCTVFAWARTNVATPASTAEGIQRISSIKGDGFFLFQPQVGGKDALGLSRNSLAAFTTAAGATAANQLTGSGITMISDAPFDADQIATSSENPLFTVPPGQPLTVLFSLLPDPIANPLPARFAIGTSGPLPDDALQRVDYVGVIMQGLKMSKPYYDALAKQAEARSAGGR